MINFWKRVKTLMPEDITQTWLAHEIGATPHMLSQWIVRGSIPRADKAQKIADALGVTVEYLVTGREPYDDRLEISYKTNSSTKPITAQTESLITIPYTTEQIIQADNKNSIYIQASWIPTAKKDKLLALHVQGDSMVNEKISNQDIVVYEHGKITDNGIYVITLKGKAYVKRLEFNPIESKIYIHSANKNYKTMEIDTDNPNYTIEGKVVLCIHRNED